VVRADEERSLAGGEQGPEAADGTLGVAGGAGQAGGAPESIVGERAPRVLAGEPVAGGQRRRWIVQLLFGEVGEGPDEVVAHLGVGEANVEVAERRVELARASPPTVGDQTAESVLGGALVRVLEEDAPEEVIGAGVLAELEP
jgi:hypothetical protein